MVDMNINHGGTDGVVEDMQSAVRQMISSLDDLVAQLTPLSTSFQGAAAEAFKTISAQRQQMDQELNQSFSTGSTVLNNMHDTMKTGDNHAASVIS